MERCRELIGYILTVYAFRAENLFWEPCEVDYLEIETLRGQLHAAGKRILSHIDEKRIRLTVIGQRELLPKRVQKAIERSTKASHKGL